MKKFVLTSLVILTAYVFVFAQVADSTSQQAKNIIGLLPAAWSATALIIWGAYEVLSHLIPSGNSNYSIIDKVAKGISWLTGKISWLSNYLNRK